MSIETPAIETRNLTKIYPGFWNAPKTVALADMNVGVKRGEI